MTTLAERHLARNTRGLHLGYNTCTHAKNDLMTTTHPTWAEYVDRDSIGIGEASTLEHVTLTYLSI